MQICVFIAVSSLDRHASTSVYGLLPCITGQLTSARRSDNANKQTHLQNQFVM